MTEEKLEFTPKFLVLGNLGLLAWILLGFLGLFFYNQLYSWLYLVAVAVIVYVVLRRLGCNNCYKCKTCTSGFGRLAGAFFGKEYVKKESVGNRVGVIVFIYVLLVPIPFAGVLFSLFVAFSLLKLLVLLCLLAVTVYSLTTWFNRSVTKKQ